MLGFLRTWTIADKLQLLHVLLDCSKIIEGLQKRLQSTFAVIEDVAAVKMWALACLKAMTDSPAAGGYEETFLSSTTPSLTTADENADNTSIAWHGFDLCQSRRRTEKAHLLTNATGRPMSAVRYEVIMCLINFIDSRLEVTDLMRLFPIAFNFNSLIEKVRNDDFIQHYGSSEMKIIHQNYLVDLNLNSLMSDFTMLKCNLQLAYTADSHDKNISHGLTTHSKLLKLALKFNLRDYAIACARLIAVFPHSMYIERLVKFTQSDQV